MVPLGPGTILVYRDFVLAGLALGPFRNRLSLDDSYFLLMFPGFWYAGKPIGLGIGPIFAVVWKFFAASVGAGFGTALIVKSVPFFATPFGASGAFLRMVSVSLLFFVLYIAGVIALHQGLEPLRQTAGLLRDLFAGTDRQENVACGFQKRILRES